MICYENYEEETCFSWTVSKITTVKKKWAFQCKRSKILDFWWSQTNIGYLDTSLKFCVSSILWSLNRLHGKKLEVWDNLAKGGCLDTLFVVFSRSPLFLCVLTSFPFVPSFFCPCSFYFSFASMGKKKTSFS